MIGLDSPFYLLGMADADRKRRSPGHWAELFVLPRWLGWINADWYRLPIGVLLLVAGTIEFVRSDRLIFAVAAFSGLLNVDMVPCERRYIAKQRALRARERAREA